MLYFYRDKTTLVVASDNTEVRATRFLDNKLCAIIMKLDGTIGDLAVKVDRASKLDDDTFIEFDRIQREVQDEC